VTYFRPCLVAKWNKNPSFCLPGRALYTELQQYLGFVFPILELYLRLNVTGSSFFTAQKESNVSDFIWFNSMY